MLLCQSCVWEIQKKRRGSSEKEPWKLNSNATLKIPKKLYRKFLAIEGINSEEQSEKSQILKDSKKGSQSNLVRIKTFIWEFDPGSGWTLAACLTHASRTETLRCGDFGQSLWCFSGGRVSNAWVTWPTLGDNSWKRLLIPHKRTVSHDTVWKTPVVWDGPASD